MKIVIVGGSIAAYTAYKRIKQIDKNIELKILSKENSKPYSKMLLPYMLNGKVNMFYEEIDDNDIVINSEATSIDTQNKTVKTKNNDVFEYDKLLIATGADAYIPTFEGNYSKDSVVGVRYVSDIEKLNKRLSKCKDKHIVLVGAGLVTLEMAWALVKKGFSVTFIVRSNRILSQILDKKSADILEKYIENNYPVKFIKENDIESIEENKDNLHITLTTGNTLKSCAVIVGKGVRPNIEFLKDTKLFNEKGIIIDSFMQTVDKDIYAAGDVTLFDDVIQNKKTRHAIWPTAVYQATIAAKNILGIKQKSLSELSRNILPVFNLNIFSGGASNTENELETYTIENGLEYRKIAIKNGKLKGFIIVGDLRNYGIYAYVAQRQINISDNINELLYGTLTQEHVKNK